MGAGVSAAIWERAVPFDATSILNDIAADFRARFAVSDLATDLPAAVANQTGLDLGRCEVVASDICELAAELTAVLEVEELEVRLERVETDSCRKFHADHVRARLITTYAGSGTQWLTEDDAQRVAAGEQPVAIRSLATGDVGIFRGKLGDGPPAMHRSPPIAETGERRLLLVLDPVENRDP